MAKSKVSEFDLDQALSSPTSAFRGPEDVVEHPTLTRAQKIEILRRWVYDATQLAVAENEGMGGGEAAEIDVVMAALDRVKAACSVEHTASTEHAAVRDNAHARHRYGDRRD